MDFTKLSVFIDSLGSQGIPGCDCAVFSGHKPVFRKMQGHKDSAGKIPVSHNDIYLLFSITKILTCCAIMKLIEEEKIFPDSDVSVYLPAFSEMTVRTSNGLRPAYKRITIRHLMTMTAGLDYNIQSPSVSDVLNATCGKASTIEIIDAIAREPLSFEPGTHYQYSLCHDVLAGVIEVVSGMTFSGYLNKIFFEPLGMKNSFFHPDAAASKRIADFYLYDPKNRISTKTDVFTGFVPSENYDSGGAGLYSSVDDYIKFASALACGGISSAGTQLLKRSSIDMMRKDQLSGDLRADFDKLSKKGYSYGLGVRTLIDSNSSKSPVGEFGWDGAAGSYVLIDPDNGISIFYAQHIMNCSFAFEHIHPTIRDLTYECMGINK